MSITAFVMIDELIYKNLLAMLALHHRNSAALHEETDTILSLNLGLNPLHRSMIVKSCSLNHAWHICGE